MHPPFGFSKESREAAVEYVASLLYPEGFGAREIVRVENLLAIPSEGESAERLAARAYVAEEIVQGFSAKWVHRTLGFSPWLGSALFSMGAVYRWAMFVQTQAKKQGSVALRERRAYAKRGGVL